MTDTAAAESAITAEWVRALPKAQTHVHVEGCIPMSVVEPAALAAGDAELASGPPALSGGLGPFLGHLDRVCRLMTEPAQLEAIALHIARTARDQGALRTEAIVNPTHWPSWADRLGDFVDAFDRGFARAEAEGCPPVFLSISAKRTQTTEQALAIAQWIVDARHPRVVALSIDGNEAASGRTGERFAPAFELARDNGIHRCVHAGESSGPEGVIDALDLLHAERIDHGVRSIEDDALVARLAGERIPLGICLTSNLTLGVAETIAAHPAPALFAAGVAVTLNTDDPELFGSDLVSEYLLAATSFGWGRAQLGELARNSITATFAPDAEKARMLGLLDGFLAGN